jgi:hypothetical protein
MPLSLTFKLGLSPKAIKQGEYLAEKLGTVVRERIGQEFVDRILDDLERGIKRPPNELTQFAEELIAKEHRQLKAAEADPQRVAAFAAREERLAAKAAKADRLAAKAERAAAKLAKTERTAKHAASKAT